MTSMEERRAKVLSSLKEMLAEDPLPLVVKTVADGFEAMAVRVAIGCIQQGNPTPLIDVRVQQSDVAGTIIAALGRKFGAFLTTLAQPRTRRPPPRR